MFLILPYYMPYCAILLPGQALRLFLVWDSEGIAEEQDVVLEALFEAAEADSDEECTKRKKSRNKDKKNKKRRVSSSTSSQRSSSSQSSEAGLS